MLEVVAIVGTGSTLCDVPGVTPVFVVGIENVLLKLGEVNAVRTDFDDNVVLFVAISDGLEEDVNVALLAVCAALNVGKMELIVVLLSL